MSEIFESLIEIRNELDKLDDTGFTREKLDHLEQIEKQQTEIESLFTNGFTCNDGSEMVVSESQMILSTLLHRNISRINSFRNRLPSSNEFLGSVEAKLENLIHNLQAIKASYLFENLESTFKLEELQSILEQVLEIETMKKMHDFENGSEYDRHWYAEDLLDTAHDLVFIINNLDPIMPCTSKNDSGR